MINIKLLFSSYKDYIKLLYSKKTRVKTYPKFDGKNIKNLSVLDFYTKPKDYIEDRVSVLKWLKPKSDFTFRYKFKKYTVKLESFQELSYGLVKSLQPMIRGIDPIREVQLVLEELFPNIPKIEIGKIILTTKIIDFFYFYNFINNNIELINKIEKNNLSYEPTADELNADLSVFNKFGVYGTIRGLSENILEDDEILKIPYQKVFTRLLWNKEQRGYQQRLLDIQKKKK